MNLDLKCYAIKSTYTLFSQHNLLGAVYVRYSFRNYKVTIHFTEAWFIDRYLNKRLLDQLVDIDSKDVKAVHAQIRVILAASGFQMIDNLPVPDISPMHGIWNQ